MLTVRISNELKQNLTNAAKANNTTVGAYVRKLITKSNDGMNGKESQL